MATDDMYMSLFVFALMVAFSMFNVLLTFTSKYRSGFSIDSSTLMSATKYYFFSALSAASNNLL